MERFKDLNLSYNQLKQEIQFLSKQTIIKNAEYNTIGTKLDNLKKEYINLQIQIKEDEADNKVRIRNDNKEYVKKLNDKEIFLNNKGKDLLNEQEKLDLSNRELEERQFKLNNDKIALNKKQTFVGKQIQKINKKKLELKEKTDIINNNIRDIGKLKGEIERNKKESEESLNRSKKILEDNEEYIEGQMREIQTQKQLLKDWEENLNKKEAKISSDMRVLINAKKHMS